VCYESLKKGLALLLLLFGKYLICLTLFFFFLPSLHFRDLIFPLAYKHKYKYKYKLVHIVFGVLANLQHLPIPRFARASLRFTLVNKTISYKNNRIYKIIYILKIVNSEWKWEFVAECCVCAFLCDLTLSSLKKLWKLRFYLCYVPYTIAAALCWLYLLFVIFP